MFSSLKQYLIKNKKWTDKCLFILLTAAILAIVCIHFINLPHANLYHDEILTIYGSRGILDQGIPVFPTGMFYSYSILNNYSVSFFMSIFGDNLIGYRMNSFLFFILSLLITYFIGKKFFSKNIALIGVLAMSLSSFEIHYAHSARMYTQLQFFVLLYIYSFYRGFIEHSTIFKWLTFISLIAGIYIKVSALILVIPTMLFLATQKKRWWHDKYLIVGFIVTTLLTTFMALLPNYLRIEGDWVNAGLNNAVGFTAKYFFDYFFNSIVEFPLGSIFILASILLLINKKAFFTKKSYLLICYFISLLIIGLIAQHFRSRYILMIFPIFLLLSFYSITICFQFLFHPVTSRKIAWIKAVSLIVVFIFYISFGYLINIGYKWDRLDRRNFEPVYEYIKKSITGQDIVICDNIPSSFMYLNKCDYRIAQIFDNGNWLSFPVEKDIRFGATILDTAQEAKTIFSYNQRIWFIDTYYPPNQDIVEAEDEIITIFAEHLKLKFIDTTNLTAAYLYQPD